MFKGEATLKGRLRAANVGGRRPFCRSPIMLEKMYAQKQQKGFWKSHFLHTFAPYNGNVSTKGWERFCFFLS
jgi:hypothetical protein